MGERTRNLVALALVALAVATACGDGGSIAGTPATAGSEHTGGSANREKISSADEVIKVVDRGFVHYGVNRSSGHNTAYLSWGLVVENVSDDVAVSVRVEADFLDENGELVEEAGNDFTVLLPGQQLGAGGSNSYDGPIVKDMDVRVSMIGSLDTPDGQLHRDPPGDYVTLAADNPAARPSSDTHEVVTVEVTNTYDVPLTPKVTAVVRDTDGVLVGGMGNNDMDEEIQPGDSATAKLSRDVQLPRLATGTIEYYVDPAIGWIVTTDPLWEELG
ncbi:hypothetical protein [Actinophytocola sediminis]